MEISISIEELAKLQESLGKKDKRIGQLEDEVERLRREREATAGDALLTEPDEGWSNGGFIILSTERIREFVSRLGMEQWALVRALVEHALPDELRMLETSLVQLAMPMPVEKPLVSIGQSGDVIESGGMKTIRNINNNQEGEG